MPHGPDSCVVIYSCTHAPSPYRPSSGRPTGPPKPCCLVPAFVVAQMRFVGQAASIESGIRCGSGQRLTYSQGGQQVRVSAAMWRHLFIRGRRALMPPPLIAGGYMTLQSLHPRSTCLLTPHPRMAHVRHTAKRRGLTGPGSVEVVELENGVGRGRPLGILRQGGHAQSMADEKPGEKRAVEVGRQYLPVEGCRLGQ